MGGCCSGRGNADNPHRRLAPAWYAKHESCSYVSSQEHGEKQPHQTGSCCTAPKEAVVTHCSCAPRCTCYRGARCRQRVTINRAATYSHRCARHSHTQGTGNEKRTFTWIPILENRHSWLRAPSSPPCRLAACSVKPWPSTLAADTLLPLPSSTSSTASPHI